MLPFRPFLLAVGIAFSTVGCATVNKTEYQEIDVMITPARGHSPLTAVCSLTNSSREISGNAPMYRVDIERSASDLHIDCKFPDGTMGRAVAVSRLHPDPAAILAGVTGTVIDHVSGKLYDYPTWVEVTRGQTRVFDANDPPGVSRQDRGSVRAQ